MWMQKLRGFFPHEKEETDPNDKKKPNPWLIWGIIIAIALLAGSSIFSSRRNTEQPETSAETIEGRTDMEAYIRQTEERLSAALSEVKGAGKVQVVLTVEDSGEKVLATDIKSKSGHQTGQEESASMTTEQEESTVMAGQGSSQQPFVVREKVPEPSGVIVIAEGADSESVRYELYEAVKALYGISPHRIKVVTSAEQSNENN